MRAGTTQLRGTSREGHTANRRRGWIGKLRSTATQPAEGTARLITTIAVIVALIGGAGPAAAQVLVSNIGQFSVGSGPTERLAGQSYAMPGSVATFGITRESPLGGPRYTANPNTLWISRV